MDAVASGIRRLARHRRPYASRSVGPRATRLADDAISKARWCQTDPPVRNPPPESLLPPVLKPPESLPPPQLPSPFQPP